MVYWLLVLFYKGYDWYKCSWNIYICIKAVFYTIWLDNLHQPVVLISQVKWGLYKFLLSFFISVQLEDLPDSSGLLLHSISLFETMKTMKLTLFVFSHNMWSLTHCMTCCQSLLMLAPSTNKTHNIPMSNSFISQWRFQDKSVKWII